MWKPGTSKPELPATPLPVHVEANEISCTPTTENEKNGESRPNSASSSAKKKTKLSGLTMNMRFMQRGAKTNKNEPKQKNTPPRSKEPPRKQQQQEDPMDVDANDNDNDGDLAEDSDGVSDRTDDSKLLPQRMATTADMYGLKSSLIGRRSFGGFNKIVAEQWNEHHQNQDQIGTSGRGGRRRTKKEHISDDELLQRYKHHVNGRGDYAKEESAAAPIGNFSNKVKKQQRRQTPQPSGEKRKRR